MSDIDALEKLEDQGHFSRRSFRFWIRHFRHIKRNKIDTWDAQWAYSVMSRKGLAIDPSVCLISNIGFGEDATHTKARTFSVPPAEDIALPLAHPVDRAIDKDTDEAVMRSFFLKSLTARILRRLKRLFMVK